MTISASPQLSLFDEIIVDNFAGGGGASTGIELAAGRPVTIAINHDPAAILMHKTNHPYTQHYEESVWNVDPVEICEGHPVGLAWFSPDCKHFSKAKGAALVDRNIRGLAWIVLRWAGTVKPRVIILENVEEFQTWGPVRKGKPIKSKSGQTFQKWLSQLRDLGYEIEYRELIAADYGAPTTRKRFVLIARCDGKPIVWPERTHAPADSAEVKSGKLKPWVAAAEIIDWSLPCPSIFDSSQAIKDKYGLRAVRPLADNTMKRVARGIDKFFIKSSSPFFVTIGYGERKGQLPRIQDIENPLSTVVSSNKQYLCTPALIQYHAEQSDYTRGQAIENPLLTVDGSNRYGLLSPILTKYYSGDDQTQASDVPLHTITTRDREALTAVHISKYYDGNYKGAGSDVNNPLNTVTAIDHNSLCATHITEFKGQDIGQNINNPLRTITTSAGEFGKVFCYLAKYKPNTDMKFWPQVREMLNTYCGYHLAEDEVLIFNVNGIDYFISDVGLRMLSPKELYRAQGFPSDYVIDVDYKGNAYSRSAQVARCGNAWTEEFTDFETFLLWITTQLTIEEAEERIKGRRIG